MHAQEELGVVPDELPSPWTAALSSFVCFSVGALVPLLPYLLGFDSLWLALAVGGVGLFVAGALVARFTGRSWLLSGLRQLLLGAAAAAATYAIGTLIGVGVSDPAATSRRGRRAGRRPGGRGRSGPRPGTSARRPAPACRRRPGRCA